MPFNTDNVRLTGDGKVGSKHGLERVTDILEILNTTKSQKLAGQEFRQLRDNCQRYYLGGPRPFPKISDPNASHGHESEPTAEIIDLGQKFMRKYTKAIDVLRLAGRGVIPVVYSICCENRMPSSDNRPLLYRGLNALVNYWNL